MERYLVIIECDFLDKKYRVSITEICYGHSIWSEWHDLNVRPLPLQWTFAQGILAVIVPYLGISCRIYTFWRLFGDFRVTPSMYFGAERYLLCIHTMHWIPMHYTKVRGFGTFILTLNRSFVKCLFEKTVFLQNESFENYSFSSLIFAMNSSGVNTATEDFA